MLYESISSAPQMLIALNQMSSQAADTTGAQTQGMNSEINCKTDEKKKKQLSKQTNNNKK